jgi:hypothetical protein
MGDKRTKSKGVLSYKKKKRSKNTLSKKVSKKRRSSKKQRTIEKQRKIIAKQTVLISKQRKTLKKQRKKLSKSLNGGGGTRSKKKEKTKAQKQRERRRRLKREAKQEEELREQEQEPRSDITWRWEQEGFDPVISQATPEESEPSRKAYAEPPSHFERWQKAQEEELALSRRLAEDEKQKKIKREKELEAVAASTPYATTALSEKWKKLQTDVRSKPPGLFSQQQEEEEPESTPSENPVLSERWKTLQTDVRSKPPGLFSQQQEEEEPESTPSENPVLSERWKTLQTDVKSKSPGLFSQQQEEEEPEESGSEIDTDEELEDILQETDELLREQEEEKKGISPFAQSSTVETGFESQGRESEIEAEVETPFTSPALRLDDPSSSESEYGSDVTQEGDQAFSSESESASGPELESYDPKAFTSKELPFGQLSDSETESEGELTRGLSTEVRLPSDWEKEQDEPEEQKQSGFLSGFKTKFSEAVQRKPIEPGLFPTQEEDEDTDSDTGSDTGSDTSSVISQEDPELQDFDSFGREEDSEDEGELTTYDQPFGLTAPKNPTDISSFEPRGQTTRKPATYSSEKQGKFASAFKKVKSVFSSPDYEELLKSNSQELKELYIAYLNEHFDDIKEGEDLDTIKQNYLSFVEQYYKEALKKDKLLLEKLKDA